MSVFIPRNAQRTTIQSVSKTLSASGATAVVPIFRILGSVNVIGLWGVVTTGLGSNHTAAYWRLNDQTAQLDITANAGTTLSAAPAGSVILKKDLAANALILKSSAAGAISEPTTLETLLFSPFVLVKKSGANTDIEFVYTTNETPTSGVIQFFIEWKPLSDGASVNTV